MSKEIRSYIELVDVCRKATSCFVGSFIAELIIRRKEWENPDTKTQFIESFHQEYFSWDEKHSIDRTRNQVNCAIRIIESHRVEEALEYVLNANNKKLDILQAKINAHDTLALLNSGKITY